MNFPRSPAALGKKTRRSSSLHQEAPLHTITRMSSLRTLNYVLIWKITGRKIAGALILKLFMAMYLECYDIEKKQGLAYAYKQKYIRKALVNKIFFVHLISLKD